MKISKNSWHYKLGEVHGTHTFHARCLTGSHTTCTYIRGVANAMFRVAAAIALILFALIGCVCFVSAMVAVPTALAMGVPFVKGGLLSLAVAPCVVGWMAVVIFLLAQLMAFIARRLLERHDSKVSLLKQARIDKKEGICTLVSFE